MNTTRDSKSARPGMRTRWTPGHGAVKAASRLPAIRIKKILLPTDFSAPSQHAARYAKAFARRFGARLVLLHVVEPVPYMADFGYGPVVRAEPDARIWKRTQTHLEAMERRQLGSERRCDSLVRSGVAFDEIVKAAKELKADLIILATHGCAELKRAFCGSTAERVVRHAPCPVLAVREQKHAFVRN